MIDDFATDDMRKFARRDGAVPSESSVPKQNDSISTSNIPSFPMIVITSALFFFEEKCSSNY